MGKITVQATVLAIERTTSNENVFSVTLDCGQPFKTANGGVGARVLDTMLSRPAEGYFVLRVFGRSRVEVGQKVPVEIETP